MEMEMEMEMVAAESIAIGEDITPPLSPLSYSLHDSFLHSHCASCFSPLPPNHHHHHHHHHVYYCSPSCSSLHSPLHLSSAANHLSRNQQTSDLRVALILLLHINQPQLNPNGRILLGLMTNRHNLLTDSHEFTARIRNGARAMAEATAMRDGRTLVSEECFLLEEAVLCAVVTNAVDVQDSVGTSVGIAVYDITFSWINHSCSPNACYRFLPPPPDTRNVGQQRFLIVPNVVGCQPTQFSNAAAGLLEICGGPRIVVRGIKMINKGEQVTIAYTDLLQPKELRQSELWSKYRFTCYCSRCVAVPLTLVDQRLQEICHSAGNLLHNLDVETYAEYIDDAIDDYLSSNDAESCCRKLEDALLNGFHEEQVVIRLHPQNHSSLNAYTTLASAYKVRATQDHEHGFKMKRFSAAYSFLLAILTHHLYLNESCLIVPVSNFWVSAGESLLNLATGLASLSLPTSCECCSRCGLLDAFEANIDSNKDLDVSSNKFLNCITNIAPEVWKFLVVENGYLEVVKDPMDLRWFERLIMSVADHNMKEITVSEGQERVELIFRLGVHCLLYGGILSNISSGHGSDLSTYVQRLIFRKTP